MKKINEIYKELITKYEKRITVRNILLIYRYFSFIITLLLYFFTFTEKHLIQKVIVMGGLVMAYTTMTILHYQNSDDQRNVLTLGIVETIENSIFLVISRGFASPFIWYFVSTIFIVAVNHSYLMAIIIAIIYFITASISTILVLLPTHDFDMVRLYLNTAISYIIVVVGVLQLIRHAVKVEDKSTRLTLLNTELEATQSKLEKTLKYSIEMYETVNIFNLHSKDNILHELLQHMRYLTGADQMMFIRLTPMERVGTYVSCGLTKVEEGIIHKRCMDIIEQEPQNMKSRVIEYAGKKLNLNYVQYEDSPCGVFVVLSDDTWDFRQYYHISYVECKEDILHCNGVIPVFMKIAGIVLKKLEFDEMEEQLLISEEQNRIANEIHDIVLQKLFAISCRLYILSSNDNKEGNEFFKNELSAIKHSIDLTMQELREAIYGFSWDKMGEDTFKVKLLKYTEEIRYLQGIEANTIIEGDTQKIRANQKHGLYRVICEAMNNAIRHGKAKHVEVRLSINDTMTTVKITDDGKGFNYAEYKEKQEKGLGLNNIFRIIEIMNGNIDINSIIDGGTEIVLSIPSKPAA